jgi:hypothetical protein
MSGRIISIGLFTIEYIQWGWFTVRLLHISDNLHFDEALLSFEFTPIIWGLSSFFGKWSYYYEKEEDTNELD